MVTHHSKKYCGLKQKPKIVISMSTKSKMETTIATKSISELLNEAWTTKAKVAAQYKKSGQTAKRLKPAFSTMGILFFDDWQFKRLFESHHKAKYINNNSSEAMKKLSNELHSFGNEITNPIVMFINQMIFEDTPQQAVEAEEILAQDVFRLEIYGTQLEDLDALMEEVILDDLPPPLHF